MAIEPRARYTYQDLVRLFGEEGDGVRRELIDGEMFVTPSPVYPHQRAVRELLVALTNWARQHGGEALSAPFDVFVSDVTVLEPDVLFVSAEHVGSIERRYLPSPPDLAVEVSSPGTRRRDLGRKKDVYEGFGVPEYWFVDLEARCVEVFRLERGRYGPPLTLQSGDRLSSPLLPGFDLSVSEVIGPSEASRAEQA